MGEKDSDAAFLCFFLGGGRGGVPWGVGPAIGWFFSFWRGLSEEGRYRKVIGGFSGWTWERGRGRCD